VTTGNDPPYGMLACHSPDVDQLPFTFEHLSFGSWSACPATLIPLALCLEMRGRRVKSRRASDTQIRSGARENTFHRCNMG